MLRVNVSASANQAKSYYAQGLSRQDYYARDHGQEIIGRWHGEAATRLGLHGEVDRAGFFALAENRHPLTGETLTARQKNNRRVGYDFTYSAPKSVALLYAWTGDRRILQAFEASVDATMREMETEMKTRVRRGCKSGVSV
jgi:conjugative relaxase-like TrwC/TraI family protein